MASGASRHSVYRGRGRTKVRAAVVAVEVDQWVTQRERLSHTHERVVHRTVAVRVETGNRVAADLRALHERSVRPEVLGFHVPQDPPVHRLETITHVGQCTADDDGHRVLEERALHLLLDLDRLDRAEGHIVAVTATGGWCCGGVTHA